MYGRPLHPDPSVRPQDHAVATAGTPPRQVRPPQTPVQRHGVPVPGTPEPMARESVDYAVATRLKKTVADRLTEEIKRSPGMSVAAQQQRGRALINETVAVWSDATAVERGIATSPAEDRRLAEAVYDLLFRAGRLQKYLDDPRIENILVNGHDQVWVDYGDAQRVAVPPVAESDEDLRELLRDLARRNGQSERTLSTSSPFLALRLEDGSRLQAITEVTPRTYVTVRRHRVRDIDLMGLVGLGSIDTTLAAFLGALIRAKKNVMIVGTQGVGKTSLLRAMAREIPPDERIGTMETEFELFLHENGHHRQIVPMESREGNGERVDGHSVGEITVGDLIYPALRMTLSRMVVGEVRGPEVVPMLRVMTNGEGGSLCTLHAREPHMVFDRIAELYMEYGGNMTESLAYKQAANGINFIVFVKMVDETAIGGRRHRFVSHVQEVTGTGENGRPATNTVFGPRPEMGEPRAVPLMHPGCLPDLMRVGFPAQLLDQPLGSWQAPLELKVMAV
ncbi:Flp pilus assembly complex ATPase component TadA [Streptomyces sp. 372A]